MQMEQHYHDSEALRIETELWEQRERKVWSLADVIYYPADFEVEFVANACPDKCSRILPLFMFPPAIIEDAQVRAQNHAIGEPKIVLFVAGFAHPPNVDAAIWLVDEIWPRIVERFPTAILYIAGSSPAPEVRALATDNIHVTGFVSESVLEALYEAAHVTIVPLRYGGGVKGKVLEAFRFGVPVVTTSVGIQGIARDPDCDFVTVADDPLELADSVARLLSDPAAATAQAKAAVRFLREKYSRDQARRLLALDFPEFAT